MVSNGAKSSFEQPAARPLARLFLKPLIHAASRDLLDEADVETNVLAFIFLLLLLAPGPLRCRGINDGLLEDTIVLESMSVATINTTTNRDTAKHLLAIALLRGL
jgi:hypothetical protein